MSYESPIFLRRTPIELKAEDLDFDKIGPFVEYGMQMGKEIDKLTFQAIERVGITVDKDELIKALQYDRDQYDKGFRDGVKSERERINNLINPEEEDD